MLRNFLYFIKTDPESSSIEEILVPDLGLELKGEKLFGLDEAKRPLDVFLEEKIAVRIHEMQKAGKVITDIFKGCDEIPDEELGHFFKFGTNISTKRIKGYIPPEEKGICEKILPAVGTISSILNAISCFVTSVVASNLAMQGSMTPTENKALSITLAFCSQLVGLGFYFGADSNSGLRNFGHKLDRYLQNVPKSQEEQKETGELKYTGSTRIKIKALKAAIATFYVINFINNTISVYQSLDALGTQAQANGSFISSSFYNFAKITQILMGSISGLSFGAGFMVKISNQLKERIVGKESVENIPSTKERQLIPADQKPSDTYTEEDEKSDRKEEKADVIIEIKEHPEMTSSVTVRSSQKDSLQASIKRGFGGFAVPMKSPDSVTEPSVTSEETEQPTPWIIKIID